MKINKILVVIIILLFGMNIYQFFDKEDNNFIEISSIDEFDQIMDKNDSDYIYIDLRDKEDYKRGHLSPFLNFPFNEENMSLLNFLNTLGKDRKIMLICYGGNRSSKIFSLLVRNGFTNITDFSVGYDEYKKVKGESLSESTGECECTD